jgi:hypothetical protein
VKIKALEPVGHYAVRIIFDDGHDTGLYTWAYFELGRRTRQNGRPIQALAARGQRSDPIVSNFWRTQRMRKLTLVLLAATALSLEREPGAGADTRKRRRAA